MSLPAIDELRALEAAAPASPAAALHVMQQLSACIRAAAARGGRAVSCVLDGDTDFALVRQLTRLHADGTGSSYDITTQVFAGHGVPGGAQMVAHVRWQLPKERPAL